MIPFQIPARALLAASAAVLLFVAGWTVNGWRLERAALRQQAEGQAQARAEEQRRTEAIKEVQREAQRSIDRRMADARAADRAHVGMLDAARAAARSGACPGATAADRGDAAASPGCAVLADVLGELDERAGALAAALDGCRTAGLACERTYNALTP